MPDPLLLAVAQPACVAHDVAANATAHAALVRAAGARVVVFPELSLTGYELDAKTVDVDDPRLDELVQACAASGTVALAGAPVTGEAGSVHIGVLAVDREGVRVAYRKMFPGGAECERFAPGREPGVVEVDGWRLGLAVCKDTGVPEHAAVTAAQGVHAYVAGVVKHAEDVALVEDRARRVASDHHLWVATASFAGATGGGFGSTAGCSGVWAPDGHEVARSGPDVGAVALATLV